MPQLKLIASFIYHLSRLKVICNTNEDMQYCKALTKKNRFFFNALLLL